MLKKSAKKKKMSLDDDKLFPWLHGKSNDLTVDEVTNIEELLDD